MDKSLPFSALLNDFKEYRCKEGLHQNYQQDIDDIGQRMLSIKKREQNSLIVSFLFVKLLKAAKIRSGKDNSFIGDHMVESINKSKLSSNHNLSEMVIPNNDVPVFYMEKTDQSDNKKIGCSMSKLKDRMIEAEDIEMSTNTN